MLIKICGLTREEDVWSLVDLPVHLAGFIFAPRSKRRVDQQKAESLLRELPPAIQSVGVFSDQSVDEVDQLAKALDLDWLQLHGGFSHEQAQALKNFGHRIIWAVPVSPGGQWLEEPWEPADLWLLDVAGAQGFGGTGETMDWSACRRPDRPFLLAGGLDPDNAPRALKGLAPQGLDFNSGLESAPGLKDKTKLQALSVTLAGLIPKENTP